MLKICHAHHGISVRQYVCFWKKLILVYLLLVLSAKFPEPSVIKNFVLILWLHKLELENVGRIKVFGNVSSILNFIILNSSVV